MMNARSISPVKLVAGLFFVFVGIILAADNLRFLDAEDYLRYWPAVLIVIGILKLYLNDGRIISIGLIVVGAWLLAFNIGVIRFTIFDLWPLILIAVGIGLVGRAFGFAPQRTAMQFVRGESLAILSGRSVTNASPDFRGGSLVALLGGYELDLTGAQIMESPATINTTAICGAIEITVPDEWEVIGEVTPVMGGFEIQGGKAVDPQRRLIVRGAAIMGAVEVKAASRRKA